MLAARHHRYDYVSILLHWATALLVGFNWAIAEGRGLLPKGALNSVVLSTHIVTGVTIAAILTARMTWRASRGKKLARAPGLAGAVSRVVHRLLYGLLGMTVCTGIAYVLVHHSRVFGWQIAWSPGSSLHPLLQSFGYIHSTVADMLVILAGLHALAAITHHTLLRDETLNRMLPILGNRLRIPESLIKAGGTTLARLSSRISARD